MDLSACIRLTLVSACVTRTIQTNTTVTFNSAQHTPALTVCQVLFSDRIQSEMRRSSPGVQLQRLNTTTYACFPSRTGEYALV